ncbi:MAG TPA: hypothetical protein VLF40_01345 [Candidatus Saccharimonadales bacterium]|nr:hypothetical protein [Candidatus Saccharimonadales bacterium]
MKLPAAENVVPGAVAAGLVSTVEGAVVIIAGAGAIDHDHELAQQATDHPDTPIQFDDGVMRSGQDAQDVVHDSLHVHKEMVVMGSTFLVLGIAALVGARLYSTAQHYKNLGSKGFIQRSLDR